MLSNEQLNFLKAEFDIVQIDYDNLESLENIRLKCFDIETEECMDRITEEGDASSDIGKRGAIAISIIDDLYTIIERKQKLQSTEKG